MNIPQPPPELWPPSQEQTQSQRRCNCTPQVEEDEDVVVIRWLSISVPVGKCNVVAGKHVFTSSRKTIRVIATGNGNEAESVRGLYQLAHDNLRENCKAANNNIGDLLTGLNTGILTRIDNKLGPLLPDGGIAGFLTRFRAKFDKFVKWIHLDESHAKVQQQVDEPLRIDGDGRV